jgi:hypothetical protein
MNVDVSDMLSSYSWWIRDGQHLSRPCRFLDVAAGAVLEISPGRSLTDTH